jgi:glycerol kinase
VDSWLHWNLTGGQQHLTDVSNASRTMLLNIHTSRWDEKILRLLNIPASLMPEVHCSSEVYGRVSPTLALDSIPLGGIAGDQQAALFGHTKHALEGSIFMGGAVVQCPPVRPQSGGGLFGIGAFVTSLSTKQHL